MEGEDKFIRWIEKQKLEVKQASLKGVVEASEIFRTQLIKEIQKGGRTGRLYKRGNVEHRASAEGEYPKSNTGTLAGSISTKIVEKDLQAYVGTNIKYGRFLEYKPPSQGGRPWLGRKLNEIGGKLQLLIITRIKNAINGK